MQITWWEYAELLEHLQSRPDLWFSDESGLWIRKTVGGDAAFALQLIPPENDGPYRMYTINWTAVAWEEDTIEDYVRNVVFYWTSSSSRQDFEKILQDELKLDSETAYLMAIALMRASVEPKVDPEDLPEPPTQEPLWAWDLPWPRKTGTPPSAVVGHMRLPYPGGTIVLTKHGEMCRVRFEIVTERTKSGYHVIAMQGFCKPLGYSLPKFFELMQRRSQEPIETSDPDSQLNLEALYESDLLRRGVDDPGGASDASSPGDPGTDQGDETTSSGRRDDEGTAAPAQSGRGEAECL